MGGGGGKGGGPIAYGRRGAQKVNPKSLIPLALVIAILLVVLIWFYPSNRDSGPNNHSWNGLTDFIADFQVSRISSLDDLTPSPQGTVLVMIPYTPFSDSELEGLREYAAGGGTLVILDDYGYGNQILDYLGVEPRFTGDPLIDPLFNYRNSSLPKITNFDQGTSSSGVEVIVLNHASSIADAPADGTMALSSRFSFLDLDDSSMWDVDEPEGPFVVACSMGYQSGHIVLISDHSILINSMLEMEDNHLFIEEALAVGGAYTGVIIDESHLPPSPLEGAQATLEVARSALETPEGTIGLALAMLVLALAPVWRKNKGAPNGKP